MLTAPVASPRRPASSPTAAGRPATARGATQSAIPAAARSVTAPSTAGTPIRVDRRIGELMQLLDDQLAPQRRVIRAGDVLHRCGDRFDSLLVLNAGFVKIATFTADGREQVVGLKLRGDWLGFDGIASGRHTCDAIAIDTGEAWIIRYDRLLDACSRSLPLMTSVHAAMSREIASDRDSLMSVCTLPADARVAGFLRNWAVSVAERGMRADQITLRMTRAEIGNYLGLTLETVSRALSRLARGNLIQFAEKGRREIRIPHVEALTEFMLASCH